MKKTILLGIAVLAVFAAVVGAGCIGADPIVGEWKAGNMPVTFNDDGTGSFEISILGFTKEYGLTWESIEGYDNTYRISTTENAIPVGEYIISEDGKTLKGPITLTKVVEE
ncbi:MAG TPA: hypothetical protein O0X95_04690 [Methanocorpusculum sp.]|nr:hypothetical protein [Methanocorpusculum sp.]HJJ41647.1 hypothetical protein [Methanocorpusculum sp.]HJJ72434.1 hypothetical protein [Methanocorpusculum sp.]